MFIISLPFGTSLTFLLDLLSAILIAVAFHHLATKPLFYFACFYFYFAVFSRRGHCRLTAIVFAAWVAVPCILRFSPPFLILAAIFIAMPFSSLPSFFAVQPEII